MKKRILALLVVGTMAAMSLAGCGSSSTSENYDSSNNAETNGETVDKENPTDNTGVTDESSDDKYSEENPYHLVFSYIEYYEQDDDARAAVQEALNKVTIPKYHIEVELLPLEASTYQNTTQLMLSGGDELDVLPVQNTYANSWINMDGIYDMSKFMEEDGSEIKDALGDDLATAAQMNGILYGLPANKEFVELGGLVMRADICDELGITEEYGLKHNNDEYQGTLLPWSEAGDIFAKVKEAYPDMTPLYLTGSSSQMNRFIHYDTLSDNFGVLDWETDNDTTKVVNKYETDTYYETVKMLADWYDKGYIYQDAATDTQGATTLMKAGNTFSYISSIKPGFLVEAKAAHGNDCYCIYFGNGNKTDEGTRSVLWTGNALLFTTSIAAQSKDPAMAFKFIKALYTDPEVMNLWQYGIENVNYKVQDDGTAYYVDGEDGSNYKYHQNTGWMMGNQFISYVWNDGSKSSDYWDKLKTHNAWGDYSKTFGFNWDSSSYSTQVTALNNALSTYRGALETGSVGSSNVDSTLKQLNDALYDAGLQDVMNAKQEQLDTWLGNK